MRFYVLGGLEIIHGDGRPAAPGSPKQGALLGLLLVERNQPLSVDRIVHGLWGDRPPASARKNLQTYVWGARRTLDREAHRLDRVRAGYRIAVEPDELDLDRFERLVDEGQRLLAAGEPAAATALAAALALWRGDPLAGVPVSQPLRAELQWLTERYLTAVEDRVQADLAAGAHCRLVPELRRLTVRYPLRERLHGQLMTALYRSGRQGDALAAYSGARLALQAEVGLEPGPALRRLQQEILTGSSTLDAPIPVAAS